MNILLALIPVTLVVIAIGVMLFFWAVNHEQFDDLDSPGVLPLMDDPPPADRDAAPGETPEAGNARTDHAAPDDHGPGSQADSTR